MKIELIFTLKTPKRVTSGEKWYDEQNTHFRDQVSELMDKADLVRVTLKNNAKYFMAEVNKECGVCDDCTEFRKYDIKKFEFFKVS